MDQIAEQAVLCHVESVHFKEVVHAVFQHHAMLAGFLGSVDQVPDLFQSHGCGNFNGHVLAFFHGIDAHWRMVFPVSHHIYQIKIVTIHKLFPGIFRAVIFGSGRHACVCHDLLNVGHT